MKVGFIGGGNMASAMIGGMIQKGVVSADDILVSVRTELSAMGKTGGTLTLTDAVNPVYAPPTV